MPISENVKLGVGRPYSPAGSRELLMVVSSGTRQRSAHLSKFKAEPPSGRGARYRHTLFALRGGDH